MKIGGLDVAPELHDFIAGDALLGTDIDAGTFWHAFEAIVRELGPRNAALMTHRDELQESIDDWFRTRRSHGKEHDAGAHLQFLTEIGYLSEPPEDVAITTSSVDPEIALVAGPQLVVPLDNARYALNAANARWGSLYDALYGTDVLGESNGCARGQGYNPVRGDRVVAAGRDFLDKHFPLDAASHSWVTQYLIHNGELKAHCGDGTTALLLHRRLAGYRGEPSAPTSILLRKNGLHCEIYIDHNHPVGQRDHAGVSDIRLESAVTTIMDCEDSVSAVDASDKVTVYRNWLGLMRGDLATSFVRDNGRRVNRSLNSEREFTSPDGSQITLPGRSLMLVRNVGPHLLTDAVRVIGSGDTDTEETVDGIGATDVTDIYETMLDAMVTAACALHDLGGNCRIDGQAARNSADRSIYIVKPKMHGPEEVALACELFERVEDALGLTRNTLKMGIMDEERRTSLNLINCIAHAAKRVVFINTGFLDRTGDDIHTNMEAGPMIPKAEIKAARWIEAYENYNVDAGLACGLAGRAQIGKGMWTMPSEMAAMCQVKIQHPFAGANTAWVPSPTAATLHAMHYFAVDVAQRQQDLSGREMPSLEDLTDPAVLPSDRELSDTEIQRELDNNVQGILGYVVRWVGQGIGCSTVLDISGIGLMEDLATLRISSQHIANWLRHGLITEQQVDETLRRMANLVDQQNSGDSHYEPMAPSYELSIPFRAARELVFSAHDEPNGYTERVLRQYRLAAKSHSLA